MTTRLKTLALGLGSTITATDIHAAAAKKALAGFHDPSDFALEAKDELTAVATSSTETI